MTKVGVLIPVYNVEEYLRECLDSVVNQTLRDIKIIIINDGSKDSSLDIINEYACRDNRIYVINKENSGYGDSMNKGLEVAYSSNVEYIAFMEPDDYISLDGYEKLYEIAKSNDVDLLRANLVSIYYDEEGNLKSFNNNLLRVNPHLYDKLINIENHKEIFSMNSNCTGLFNSRFLKDNEIWFNTTPGASYQDIGFWFQSYALSKRLFFTENRYYHYRRNRPGASEHAIKNVYTICEEMKFIYDFLLKHPSIKEKYRYEYYKTMYTAYSMILQKADESKWSEFLDRIALDYTSAMKKGEITKEEIKSISKILDRIVESPAKFLNDNIEQLREAQKGPFFKIQ